MAGLTAKTYAFKDEIVDVIVRRMHSGKLPEGVMPLITNNAQQVTKTFYGPSNYNIIKYADGWTGGLAPNKWEKTFVLGEVKSEMTFGKQTYLNSVQMMAADIQKAFQNDVLGAEIKETVDLLASLSDIRGNEEEALAAAAELMLFIEPFVKSAYLLMMLGDTDKVTLEGDGSTTYFPSGALYSKYAADIRFNAFDGLWKNIFDIASTSPTAQQVKKIAFAKGATAQVSTLTLSGSAGTATVSFKGVSKVATFATSLTATATAFVAANAAAYAAVGVTLTSSTADLIFTNDEIGVTIDAATGVNLTGNLAGTNVTTAATAASALANGDCEAQMALAWAGRPNVMREIPKEDLVFLVTSNLYDNYANDLQGNGTIVVESQRSGVISGIPPEQMKYNGVQLFEMPIDNMISSYFGGYAPYRILLIPKWNLAPIYSSNDKTADLNVWFERKDNLNEGRIQASFGMDIWEPQYCVAVY